MHITSRIPIHYKLLLAMLVVGAAIVIARSPAQAAELEILVTSTGDSVLAGESECPSATLCTLRRAIEMANAAAGDDPVIIRFDDETFDSETPATLGVADTALPSITRDGVSIDARGAGVILDGTDLASVVGANGIGAQATAFTIYGMTVRSFPGDCITVTGDDAIVGGSRGAGMGNRVDDCGRGIVVAGSGMLVQGNVIGLSPVPAAEPMASGIEAMDGDTLAGVLDASDEGNIIGNAETGIVFRASAGESMTGIIRGNTIGASAEAAAAPVTTGIRIVYGAESVTVTANHIANAETGISIPDNDGPASTGNSLRGNTFDDIETLAIDLGEDGRTLNDAGSPGGDGANGLLSYPEFTRAVQDEITGTVPGPCMSCIVDLYLADRRLDGRPDVPLTPVAGGSTIANASGEFTFTNPPAVPGQWLMAIATDDEGNTSEFSDAVRLGSGVVQCGNVTLHPGWNTSGFFGAPTALGGTFPAGTPAPGPVTSIHQLNAGTRDFDSWYASRAGFGTLTALSTGEPYWFYALSEVQLTGSFTLAEPLPVDLEEGWNDFVYIGGEDFVASALESIDGQWSALYRWVNDGATAGWETYGSPDTPEWAHGFETMTPCAVYLVLMTEDGTLTPPQP